MSQQTKPKIALVCDWLTNPGGAEKVLLELHRMYPDAPIYTSQYNRKKITWFNNAKVITSWVQIFPSGLRKYLGLFRQIYFSHLDLSNYDVVISVTGAEAKSVKTVNHKKGTKAYHICYCHVPTQYYWRKYDEYMKNPGFGIFDPLARLGLKILVKPLRKADLRAVKRPDQFVTISHYSAEQIKKYYHRSAKIIYPVVDIAKFSIENQKSHNKNTEFSTSYPQDNDNNSTKKSKKSTEISKLSTENAKISTNYQKFSTKDYYIISCRQVTWKRVDLAVLACQKLNCNLLVVGEGPEHNKLVKLAQDSTNICFLPWQSSASLAELLRNAQAYIFPSEEPFGIAAAEALAAGCPVIAFKEGGSRDIVDQNHNGLLFAQQTVDSLVLALRKFEQQKFWSPTRISASAEQFSAEHFDKAITKLVQGAVQAEGKQ